MRDLAETAAWIAKDNPKAARTRRAVIEKSALTIGEYPLAGSDRPEIVKAPYRCFPLAGFPYILIYNPERVPARIVRVPHTARDLPAILRSLV